MNVATETDRNLRAEADALLRRSNAAFRKLIREQDERIAALERRLAAYETAEARQAFDLAERASNLELAADLALRDSDCAALIAENARLRGELDALLAQTEAA